MSVEIDNIYIYYIYKYCDTVSHLIVDSESKRLQSWFWTCNTLENTEKHLDFANEVLHVS